MKEDYCNFEIAKLLKEKGFNEICAGYYDRQGRFAMTLSKVNNIRWEGHYIAGNISAPTHQMAMKWLREVHNIHITIDCDICDSFDFYSIIRIKSEESWKTYVEYEDEGSNTYEEAVEKAIEYCLTNLI